LGEAALKSVREEGAHKKTGSGPNIHSLVRRRPIGLSIQGGD